MARVLLLMPKTSYRAEPFLEAARRLNVAVQVGSDRCHVLAEHWGVPLALDFREPLAAAEQIVAATRAEGGERFDAIVATDDRSTLIASLASERLGLRANSPQAARAARDKEQMRACFARAALPSPAYRVLEASVEDADFALAAEELGYPVVIKPLLMSGSRGVMRVDDEPALVRALARLRRILRAPDVEPSEDPAASRILIERFVAGGEIAVEALLGARGLDVLAIFDKPRPLDGPCFEESVYVTPSRLAAPVQRRIAELVERAARALGLSSGPVHAELRVDGSSALEPRLWLVEVAGRSIGGLCSRTLELGLGRTLEELILADALGLRLEARERSPQASGVLMLPIPGRGLLRGVTGLEEARAVPGVLAIEITAKLDHEVVPLPEGSSYLGFVFARAADPAGVERALGEAERRLGFQIVPNLALRR